MALIRCGGTPISEELLGKGKYFNTGGYALSGGTVGSFTKGTQFTLSNSYINIILVNVEDCTTCSYTTSGGWMAMLGIESDGTCTQLVDNKSSATDVDITDYEYVFFSTAGGATGTTLTANITIS